MRKTIVAVAATALFCAGEASAGPITLSVFGSNGTLSDVSLDSTAISGSLDFDTSQDVFLMFTGFDRGVDYSLSLGLPSMPVSSVSVELLNATGRTNAFDNAEDQNPQPGYVPAGWSTSTDYDGFSFAQNSDATRSFMGGAAAFGLTADETTNMRDLLTFSGMASGVGSLELGLRSQKWGGDAFLLRLSVQSVEALSTPEPASMLLMGAGLLGAATEIRRRRRRMRG